MNADERHYSAEDEKKYDIAAKMFGEDMSSDLKTTQDHPSSQMTNRPTRVCVRSRGCRVERPRHAARNCRHPSSITTESEAA